MLQGFQFLVVYFSFFSCSTVFPGWMNLLPLRAAGQSTTTTVSSKVNDCVPGKWLRNIVTQARWRNGTASCTVWRCENNNDTKSGLSLLGDCRLAGMRTLPMMQHNNQASNVTSQRQIRSICLKGWFKKKKARYWSSTANRTINALKHKSSMT